ncbi:UNVERIFIED_CONTAM: GIY-YIG nuclease family protein [Campylobacter lari]
MNKGIIYVMTTVVDGLIKIGQTQTKQYKERMMFLENNGYRNISGFNRHYAIEVDDYIEKEKLLHNIFNKSRLGTTELFALDVDLVVQLLSSFEGKQIYPENKNTEETFIETTKELEDREGLNFIPNGIYYLKRKVKDFGEVEGKMKVEDGHLIVLKGSICANSQNEYNLSIRQKAKIENNILQEDIVCSSPSAAGNVILGKSNNG